MWNILKNSIDRCHKVVKLFSYAMTIGLNRLLWIIETIEIEYGHHYSFREKQCIDKNGYPVPWYTYPAIEYLKQLDFSGKNVFEYGSGNSSIFWARKAMSVTSIENNKKWFLLIENKKHKNQKLLFIENEEEYINFISKNGMKYDLIIIDGICRLACAKVSVNFLEKGGLIILDNSDWYPETARFLRDSGLIQVDFTGLGPINYYTWTTSLFFHRDINLRAQSEVQPEYGIASIRKTNPE
jgi:hypothetical protein